jgi:hypothetical protein
MAEDRDLILGGLVEGFKGVKEHLERQDKQRDIDRTAAIKAREEKHAENLQRFKDMEEKATNTYGVAMVAYRWVDEVGKPMVVRIDAIHDRVKAIEDEKKDVAAETRGSLKTWGIIGAIATAIGTVLAGVITYGRDALDLIAGKH